MTTTNTARSLVLAGAGLLLIAGICAADTDSTDLQRKIESIIIPEIDFRGAGMYDVMCFFTEYSRKLDTRAVPQADKGIDIVLTIPPSHRGHLPLITFTARKCSVGEALRIVTSVAGLEHDLHDNWIHVHPPVQVGQALPAFRKRTQSDAAVEERLKTIIVAEADYRMSGMAEFVTSINELISEHAGGDEKATKVLFDPQQFNVCEASFVTFEARRMSVYDAVRIVAYAAMMECEVVGQDVRLRPAKARRKPPPPLFPHIKHARSLTLDTFPILVGSHSVRPLQMVVACRLMGADCAWVGNDPRPVAVQSSRMRPTDPRYMKALEHCKRVGDLVRTDHVDGAYRQLIYGHCRMVLAERKPSDDERRLAKVRGGAFDVRPVALDALVFTVNCENPVKSLSSDQIRAIYSGDITNWKAVGGPDAELRAFHRPSEARSRLLMTRLVLKDRKSADLPDIMTMGMCGAYNRLISDKQGLGYSSFFQELRSSALDHRRIVPVSVDGVKPTPDNLSSRAYPYVTELYLVTQKDLRDRSAAALLRDWLLSEEGQAVIAESGYVSIGSEERPAPSAK